MEKEIMNPNEIKIVVKGSDLIALLDRGYEERKRKRLMMERWKKINKINEAITKKNI